MDKYFACVNPDCLIVPKFLKSLMDRKKHISRKCKLVEMVTIQKDVIADIPFFELFTQNELEKHLIWADESLRKIRQGFEQFFGQFSFSIINQIKENFIEVKRLYQLFSAVKNQDITFLEQVRGDLSSLVNQCRVTNVLYLLQENQTNIHKQLKDIQQQIIQNNKNHPIQFVDLITSQPQIISRQPQLWNSQLNDSNQSEQSYNDYFACVNPDCLIDPKILTSFMDQKKHFSPMCKMVEMEIINKDLIADLPFFDQFTQNELNQHLIWANESLEKIQYGFQQFFGQFSFSILNQIKENFIEVKRLYQLFLAAKNQDVSFLEQVKGDLSSLVDQCKVTNVLQLLQKNQTNIHIQLKELQIQIIQNNKNHPIQIVDLITSQPQIIQRQPQWWDSQIDDKNQQGFFQVTFEKNKEINFNFKDQIIEKDVMTEMLSFIDSKKPLALNLNYVQQFGNKITDINPLAQICSLTYLTILKIGWSSNLITDTTPLAELKQLINLTTLEIRLDSNQIIDIKPIAELKQLTKLTTLKIDLRNNQITDIKLIADLKSLTNLKNLDIGLDYNQIIDIRPIAELKQLTKLTTLKINLKNNKITDMKPIADFKSLTNLTNLDIGLHQNQIIDINPMIELNQLTKLTTLKINLRNNKITDIKPIADLKSLSDLTNLDIELDNNQIIDIMPIAELKQLTKLTTLKINLMNNKITDIKPIADFKSLTNLTNLDIGLYSNQIIDIKPIAEIKSLFKLNTLKIDLDKNQITDNKPIADLKSLNNLISLKIILPNQSILTIASLLLIEK